MKTTTKTKKLNRWKSFDTVVTVLTVFICIITAYPMIYVIACSISNPVAVMGGQVVFWPVGFTTAAYEVVLMDTDFWRCMLNSVFYVTVNCILTLFTTVAMAYPLTRPNLKFRKFITYYLLIPMYFSGGMIPCFLVYTKLGLYNSPWVLILPCCYGIWYIILCRTYMASMSQELIDSALIDGCNQIWTLVRIVVPLAKPVLAVIMIYTIVNNWNSWFHASITVTKQEIQPVQLYLKVILDQAQKNSGLKVLENMSEKLILQYEEIARSANQIKYAMIVISTVPILLVYPMFQKHFTKGIMLGSLKG